MWPQVEPPAGTLAAANSKPGFMAMFVAEMEKPGHWLAADDCAMAVAVASASADAAASSNSGLQ